MATLSPRDYGNDKNAQRRQSQCIRQQSVKQLHDDKFEQQIQLLKQQETLRIRPQLSDQKPNQTHIMMDYDESSFEQGYGQTLRDLANEVQLQKLALERASQIIGFLTQQNESINDKMQQYQRLYEQIVEEKAQEREKYIRKLQAAEDMIKDLEERSTKNESILGGSVVLPKSGRYTPIKVYPKQEEDYMAPLTQIQKTIINKRIQQLQEQLNYLEQIIKGQQYDVKEIMEQQKYLQNYLEDQFFHPHSKIVDNSKFQKNQEQLIAYYQQIIVQQQKTIKEWEKYAHNLQINLMESIQFIQDMGYDCQYGYSSHHSSQQGLTNCIKGKDIVEHVCKKVCKMKTKETQRVKSENRQLREIIEQLICKMRSGSSNLDTYMSKSAKMSKNT